MEEIKNQIQIEEERIESEKIIKTNQMKIKEMESLKEQDEEIQRLTKELNELMNEDQKLTQEILEISETQRKNEEILSNKIFDQEKLNKTLKIERPVKE
jgi:hypothetical protein